MKGETTAEEILRIKSILQCFDNLSVQWVEDYGDMTMMSFALVQFGIY